MSNDNKHCFSLQISFIFNSSFVIDALILYNLFADVAVNAVVELINGLAQRRQRTCIPDYVKNIIPVYSEKEFIMHYRLKRMLVTDIIDKFNQWLHFRNLGGHGGFEPISAEKHIFTFLWFAGHQSASFRDVADRFNVSLSTLESILRRVTQFLYEMRNEVIRYPTEAEKQRTQRHYFENKDFPGVIGSIDGSHIRIDKPSEDPVAYINRKRYFSVHMQGTVNEKKKFLDVFVGYPGSVHDARVFANSSLAEDLSALCQGGGVVNIEKNTLYERAKETMGETVSQGLLNSFDSDCIDENVYNKENIVYILEEDNENDPVVFSVRDNENDSAVFSVRCLLI
ncbi:Putative nuclease HARBI1 [Trachymyrmex cornetzi]|uniref:Putative nuclease HARBI1 n=1 Tax=Trachymyrmex cornetzi TaxID=471704 RepID=A0A151J867_9HYME|nr:Putative nuclease HARBI1 [Trachymyrmex cornetzi]